MTPDYEELVRRLEAHPGNLALLSQQALPTADFLHLNYKDTFTCLFSAEHGWFGLAGAGEKTGDVERHPFLGVPVFSLYGDHRKPTPEMLSGISRLVIDMADLGIRCFTYLATLNNVLEACAEAGVAVTVLDRPIPLGGMVDGPRLEAKWTSFVAPVNVPLAYGMTPGETALHLMRTRGLDLDLDVVPVDDWKRFERTPWPNFMPPSPGIRSWDSAIFYPMTVFTEACVALDCDRQGPLAFRVLGAPWLDVRGLVVSLRDPLADCGVAVRPFRYRSSGGTYAGQVLDGLLFTLAACGTYRPVRAGLRVLAAVHARHPQEMAQGFRAEWMDKLCGTSRVREALEADCVEDEISSWCTGLADWESERVRIY